MKWLVWPQYTVEPQHIEGCFDGKLTIEQSANLVLLSPAELSRVYWISFETKHVDKNLLTLCYWKKEIKFRFPNRLSYFLHLQLNTLGYLKVLMIIDRNIVLYSGIIKYDIPLILQLVFNGEGEQVDKPFIQSPWLPLFVAYLLGVF